MNYLNKSLLLFLSLIAQPGLSSTDLSIYNPSPLQINNQSFPRQLTDVYLNQKLKDSKIQSFLESFFISNQKINLYSKLVLDVDLKLQGKRVDNDVYKYIRGSQLKSLIKKERSSYKSINDTMNVLETFLKGFDQKSFQSTFLDSSQKSVERSLFLDFSSTPLTQFKEEYASVGLKNVTSTFDYGFYLSNKVGSQFIQNTFISPLMVSDARAESYEVRRADGSIRYGFYNQSLGRESVLLVLDGEGSNCIVKNADFNYSFCDYKSGIKMPLENSPKLIGIIKKCGKLQPCSIQDSVWSNFKHFSNRKVSSYDFKAINNVFSKHSQNYLHFEKPLLPMSGGSFSHSVSVNDPLFSELNNIAQKDSIYHGMKVKKIYSSFTSTTPLSVTYELDDPHCSKASKSGEECLSLHEAIYFLIPKEFQDKSIVEMTIAHRQNTNDNRGTDSFNSSTGQKVKDKFPSFISAQIYSPYYSYKYAWRYWGGHTSGINGGKYSEHKKNGSWEYDNLYEWPLYGHKASHQQDNKSQIPLKGKYLRLFADIGKYSQIKGYDSAYVHSVTIQFAPEKADMYKYWSFTNTKTDLGDPLTMQGRSYGGGPKFKGHYPGAVILRGSKKPKNTNKLDLSSWDYSRRGYIEYDLIPGLRFKSIEIAAGDTHPDDKPNKDGGTGSLGGAKLSVELLTSSGELKIINRANLGPKGVTTGYPPDLERVIQRGDKIRIYGHNDNAYLMGIRIGYGN